MESQMRFTQASEGWLAERPEWPKFAGYGPTKEAAAHDLDRIVAAFNRSLFRAAQRQHSRSPLFGPPAFDGVRDGQALEWAQGA